MLRTIFYVLKLPTTIARRFSLGLIRNTFFLLKMSPNWKTFGIAAAATVSAVGVVGFIWNKRKRSFVKVGSVSKLYFFPVKGLKGMEVTAGRCTELGFEVDGLLDRSFMLVDGEGVLISQKKGPSLALLSVQIDGKVLTISAPSGEKVNVKIKDSADNATDKFISCRIVTDTTKAVDCGDEAASFFQSYLNMPGVRLVRYFPKLVRREYQPKGSSRAFDKELRKENPHLAFQNYTAFHLVSKSSVDDLNSKLDKKISELNFRPNILVEGCKPFAEDSWNFIKFRSGSMLCNLTLFKRCLITTNDPDTGVLNVKEPLATLKTYRIPTEPEVVRKTGANPCLGIGCGVCQIGDIAAGDDVFADVGPQPKMTEK